MCEPIRFCPALVNTLSYPHKTQSLSTSNKMTFPVYLFEMKQDNVVFDYDDSTDLDFVFTLESTFLSTTKAREMARM